VASPQTSRTIQKEWIAPAIQGHHLLNRGTGFLTQVAAILDRQLDLCRALANARTQRIQQAHIRLRRLVWKSQARRLIDNAERLTSPCQALR